MHNDIVRAIDAGDVSALVLLDLSAAFDTVDDGVLLDVLNLRFGIEDRALAWFRSYLSNRMQHAIVLRCLWNIDSCNPAVQRSARLGNWATKLYCIYGGPC